MYSTLMDRSAMQGHTQTHGHYARQAITPERYPSHCVPQEPATEPVTDWLCTNCCPNHAATTQSAHDGTPRTIVNEH